MPFTPDEQDEIARHLDEVKRLAREQFELTIDQLQAFDEKADEIKEASERLGRKD